MCELQPEKHWEHLGIKATLGTSWVLFKPGFFSLGSSLLTVPSAYSLFCLLKAPSCAWSIKASLDRDPSCCFNANV